MGKIYIGNSELNIASLGTDIEYIYLGDVLVWAKTTIPQLNTPIISFKENTNNKIVKWNEIDNAIGYDIYIDGIKKAEVRV